MGTKINKVAKTFANSSGRLNIVKRSAQDSNKPSHQYFIDQMLPLKSERDSKLFYEYLDQIDFEEHVVNITMLHTFPSLMLHAEREHEEMVATFSLKTVYWTQHKENSVKKRAQPVPLQPFSLESSNN